MRSAPITGLASHAPSLSSVSRHYTAQSPIHHRSITDPSPAHYRAVIGPLVLTQIVGYFTDEIGLLFPGVLYIFSLALLLISIAVLWPTLPRGSGDEGG